MTTNTQTEERRREYLIPLPTARRIAGRLISKCKYRAKKSGVPVRLNKEAIAKKIAIGRCEASDLTFVLEDGGAASSRARYPSIDRINVKGGYTTKNTRVTIWALNRFRADMHIDDFEDLLASLRLSPTPHQQ